MLEKGEPIEKIAETLGRTQDAIIVKAKRCGFPLPAAATHTTTMLTLPEDVMDPERALKILQAALERAAKAGLDKVEVQRLTAIGNLARTFYDLHAVWEHLKDVEKSMKEINERLAILEAQAKATEPEDPPAHPSSDAATGPTASTPKETAPSQ
jgi:predicted Zn-ribbon and HTH transcriptional regulator